MDKSLLFKGKNILVTGGAGSIGSEIVKQLLAYDPASIRILDIHENGHFTLAQGLQSKKVRHLIGDIRDKQRVERAMHGVDIVFHAAALKHVPLCEYNPFEAVSTNVMGTQNLVHAAIDAGVERFIGISTDKAVEPISTMGATKLLSEKVITNAPISHKKIKFCCVRFGNVLASSGSVIPTFKKQIKQGHELTITHPEMTRFFMSIHDAVSLVLDAAHHVEGGEVFIFKMPALKITDLAQVLVEELAPQHGKNPEDFSYSHIGIRDGEKLYEALLSSEEAAFAHVGEKMIVLKNSLLANYGKGPQRKDQLEIAEYTSKTAPLLDKEEIRSLLHTYGILNK